MKHKYVIDANVLAHLSVGIFLFLNPMIGIIFKQLGFTMYVNEVHVNSTAIM